MGDQKSATIVGAGFFGLTAAIKFANSGYRVVVHEQKSDIMQGASLFNQARVHGGYHYPRSLKTAARCRANYDKFIDDYQSAIVDNFNSIYAIAQDSKVSSEKFVRLMNLIGAPTKLLKSEEAQIFDPSHVSKAYLVNESAFDSTILSKLVLEKISSLNIEIKFNSEVVGIQNVVEQGKSCVRVMTAAGENTASDLGVLTTYGLDNIHANHDFSEDFLYEVCELVKIQPLGELKNMAVTVVDGSYWSVTPWPSFDSHVLTHVKYTPHARFTKYYDAKDFLENSKNSRSEMMIRDSARYLPLISDSDILGSEYTIKTILRKRDHDDARPILVQRAGRLLSILGSKIDNVYEIDEVLDRFIRTV